MRIPANIRQLLLTALSLLLFAAVSPAQQSAPSAGPAAPSPAPATDAEFMKAADEVMAEMAKLLSLPALEPLKKTVRSREQIRDYLVQQMRDDKDNAKQHADQKALEAMGLIPKGYPLQPKLLALLTEQIAGLYDPKGREFFIADWTDPGEQRMIMAHELTHALQDQHFHIQKWEDAAKANDDASLARQSVLEGSATVAMLDYLLRETGRTSRDIGDLDPSLLMGDASDSPELSQAPMVIQDEMLFPYVPGAAFIQHVLKAWNGWPDMHKLFEHPPASTQQILHPDLYLRGVEPADVKLAPALRPIPKAWKKLDENVLGEFGINEILKQFLGKDEADKLSPSWAGDRYAIYERRPGGQTLLVILLRLGNQAEVAPFFAGYADALERKDQSRTGLVRSGNFLSFNTPDGGVFLRCSAEQCLSVEGSTQPVFDAMTAALGWPAISAGSASAKNPSPGRSAARTPPPQVRSGTARAAAFAP